jgi:hypothetical protein
MFNNINLDDTAKAYIINCLAQGNKYASLLASLPLRKVTAFLPDELEGVPIDYSRSIDLTFRIRIYDATRSNIYEVVRLFLQSGNHRFALIETYYRSGDLEKIVPLPGHMYSENEIYFLLKPYQNGPEIKNAFSSARDYPFVCGLIDLSGVNVSLTDNQPISPNWWNTLAKNTKHIIVNAFDNEGFLLADVED